MRRLFKNNIEKNCAYCMRGYILSNGTECLCDKYGIITAVTGCKKFKYDPLKRVPHRTPDLPNHEDLEFSI